MISSIRTCILLLIAFALPIKPASAEDKSPLVLAHYMPWYVAKPTSKAWGWHWTMNHFDPEKVTDEKREIASHFYPTIGPYDSGDPHVIEYHLLTMKLAGLDGVIVDWYGLTDLYDYAILHRNTTKLIEQAERFGMKFIICYEDQTIPALVKAKRIKESDRVAHAVNEIKWLDDNWFKLTGYVRVRKQPALLSFGHAGLKDEEWSECLQSLERPISYFSEHYMRNRALGMYDWPIPSKGIAATTSFNRKLKKVSYAIPVAYPRFVDIYKQAKVKDGYGLIEDNNGRTFTTNTECRPRDSSQHHPDRNVERLGRRHSNRTEYRTRLPRFGSPSEATESKREAVGSSTSEAIAGSATKRSRSKGTRLNRSKPLSRQTRRSKDAHV